MSTLFIMKCYTVAYTFKSSSSRQHLVPVFYTSWLWLAKLYLWLDFSRLRYQTYICHSYQEEGLIEDKTTPELSDRRRMDNE